MIRSRIWSRIRIPRSNGSGPGRPKNIPTVRTRLRIPNIGGMDLDPELFGHSVSSYDLIDKKIGKIWAIFLESFSSSLITLISPKNILKCLKTLATVPISIFLGILNWQNSFLLTCPRFSQAFENMPHTETMKFCQNHLSLVVTYHIKLQWRLSGL